MSAFSLPQSHINAHPTQTLNPEPKDPSLQPTKQTLQSSHDKSAQPAPLIPEPTPPTSQAHPE